MGARQFFLFYITDRRKKEESLMEPKQKTVLVIDDEADLLEMIKFQFEAKGHRVFTAGDGLEGLQKLNSIYPDLIILDMNMPKMGGIDFYNSICDAQGKSKYPVLVLTARSNMEELFKNLHVDGFMTKPFDIEVLLQEAQIIMTKKDKQEKQKIVFSQGAKKILIADDSPQELAKISQSFLEAGYLVQVAHHGTEAIERVVLNGPDVTLIKLGMSDIAGDVAIFKLLLMPKTARLKYVLYTAKDDRHKKIIMDTIKDKKGVSKLIEYYEPEDLLDAVAGLFIKDEEDDE
jgi:CheY-like chemotaxis protein